MTTPCISNNKVFLGSSEKKVKWKDPSTSVYSPLTVLTQSWTLTNIFSAAGLRICVIKMRSPFWSFFFFPLLKVQEFYTALMVITTYLRKEISLVMFEKNDHGFQVCKSVLEVIQRHIVRVLVWTQDSSPSMDLTSFHSLMIQCMYPRKVLGTWNAVTHVIKTL